MAKPKNRVETKYHNVFRLKGEERFWIRVQVKNELTGEDVETSRYLKVGSPEEARDEQQKLARKLRRGEEEGGADEAVQPFAAFGAQFIKHRWSNEIITSYETKRRYEWELGQLIQFWGNILLDKISDARVEVWRAELGERMRDQSRSDALSPWSGKGIISLFKLIMAAAAKRWKFYNPASEIASAPTKRWAAKAYPKEQPNSLRPDELRVYLDYIKQRYPQHYAMFCLGFLTGRRPCELRPLRCSGPQSDLNWETGELEIRRSLVRAPAGTVPVPNEGTKTGKNLTITLPPWFVEQLRQHVARRTVESDLLFPGRGRGGFCSKNILESAMEAAARDLKLTKHLTPRFMRRTVQDLARKEEVKMVVLQSMTGHSTAAMVMLYSTPYASEQQEAITGMARLAGIKPDGETATVEDKEKKAA